MTTDTPTPEALTVATTETIELAQVDTRLEHDLLGEREVPTSAYWGVHTLRAVENFPITGVPVGHFPELVKALAHGQAGRRPRQSQARPPARPTRPSDRPGLRRDHRAAASPSSSWSTPSRAAPAPRPT